MLVHLGIVREERLTDGMKPTEIRKTRKSRRTDSASGLK